MEFVECNKISVAVQQHFLSHYREGIYRLMSAQSGNNPEYTFFSDKYSKEGIEVIDQSKLGEGRYIRWFPLRNFWIGKVFLFQFGLLKISLSRKYQCIIYLGSMYHISTWVGAILARCVGKRVIMWTHGYLKEEKSLKGLFRETFYRLSNSFLLYGNRARGFLERRGFSSDDLYVVYNSLDYDRQVFIRGEILPSDIINLRSKLFKNSNIPVFVFTGRLTKRKKIGLFLKAMSLLEKRGELINFLIIGEGEEKDDLVKYVNSHGLKDRVNFFGACYNEEELAPLIMMADACISPGEVGLTCIHSMTYGVPVITHDDLNTQGPECEAITHGRTGFLFKKDDVDSLVLIIIELLQGLRSGRCYRDFCFKVVEDNYSPRKQLEVINRAVLGLGAVSEAPHLR